MDKQNRRVKTAAKLLLDYLLEHRIALQADMQTDAPLAGLPPTKHPVRKKAGKASRARKHEGQ